MVADTKYGKRDNFLLCSYLGIKAHMPSIEEINRNTGRRKGIFSQEAFVYDTDNDTFTCPTGQILKQKQLKKA